MKKIFLSIAILVLTFSLVGCFKSNKTDSNQEPQFEGAKPTGVVLDITEKNGQSGTVKPGDILYLKLTGEAASGKQWTVVSPATGDYLMLKDHKLIGLADSKAPDGQFTDEWWLKVEKTGNFELKFDYGVMGEKAEKSFQFSVITQ